MVGHLRCTERPGNLSFVSGPKRFRRQQTRLQRVSEAKMHKGILEGKIDAVLNKVSGLRSLLLVPYCTKGRLCRIRMKTPLA